MLHRQRTRRQTRLALQNSLRFRRFDRSFLSNYNNDNNNDNNNNHHQNQNHHHIGNENSCSDEALKPLLWNMLYLACLDMNLESIQENPTLVRYVDNMFDHDVDQQYLTRIGVIADYYYHTPVDDDVDHENHPVIVPGIGAAWIQCWNPKANLPGYGMVREDIPELTMAVSPDYQGKGIGARLLQEMIQYAKEEKQPYNIPAISLCVQADNHRAVRLYQRLGFVKEQGTDYTNEQGTTWYDMVRWL